MAAKTTENQIVPKKVRAVALDFYWNLQKLWRLRLPKTYMNIDTLLWHFNIPFLWKGDKPYALTPLEVIKNPARYPYEYQRTLSADLEFPIDVIYHKGRWLILDGLHRLMKSWMLGYKKVKVRVMPHKKVPKIKA